MEKTKSKVDRQVAIICRRANCQPSDLPNLTTLDAWGNSGITDAGLARIEKRSSESKPSE